MKYTTKAAAFLRLKLDEGKVPKGVRTSSLASKEGAKVKKLKKADSKEDAKRKKEAKQKVLIKWKWSHRFSLVVCHPMGCYSTFFLGPEGLVKDLLAQSKTIRDYCKILCPGARHIEWGKQWFRYRSCVLRRTMKNERFVASL
eukprot:g27605.t1